MIRSTKNIYLLIMSLFVLIAFASFNYSKFNFTFLDGKEILERRFLRSGDSECLLVEARDAYAIYDCSNGAFLEGSLETNSPYYDVKDDKLYYYGLGNYYDSSNRITAFTKENSTYKDEEINKELNYSNMQDSSYVNELGYTMIKDSYYFENLTYFPTNYLKTCGLVALSILLAYYDTFYNDNFIDNDLTYLERIYEDENSFITNYDVPAINRVYREYSYDYSFDYQSIKDMPGASQSFHDYLFDNYLSTFILDKEIYTFLKQGYPIDAFNLAKIYSAYISKENNYIYNNSNYIADIIMYTHSRPKELINDGLPVILVLTSYKYKTSDSGSMSDEKFWHDIVAYGYKEIRGNYK